MIYKESMLLLKAETLEQASYVKSLITDFKMFPSIVYITHHLLYGLRYIILFR